MESYAYINVKVNMADRLRKHLKLQFEIEKDVI